MKIGYLGPAGSYSYDTAIEYASLHDFNPVQLIPYGSFSRIIESVEQGIITLGVLPVENSTYGAVATAMDLLLDLKDTTIYDEYLLNIHHSLLSHSSNIHLIKYVYSHEQALEQCRNFFASHLPNVQFIPCSSTTRACELALEGGMNYGAIAGRTAAEIYQLHILKESIQDNEFNQTRFLIISKVENNQTTSSKTSIVFSFPFDSPGNLFNVLAIFASKNLNLTRIESRPAKNMMGNYIFYIDFLGHINDSEWALAMAEIKPLIGWIKVLGSYPVFSSKK